MNVPITTTDASAVAQVLCDHRFCGYPQSQVTLLHDAGATCASALNALDLLAAQTTSDDTIFLFYCGHGKYDDDGTYYLTTYDTRIANHKVVAGTGISHQQIIARLKALPARRVLMIINACHAGYLSPTLSTDTGAQGHNVPQTLSAALLATGEGRIIITACREHQYSFIGDGTLTIFAQALVDSLSGKGVVSQRSYVSVFDLYASLYGAVSDTVRALYNRDQHPELTIHKGVGPFPVALYQGSAPRTDAGQRDLPLGHAAVQQVEQEESQRLLTHIQSGGISFGPQATVRGDFIGGNEQIGRDKVGGHHVEGDLAGRDIYKPQQTFNISGTIQSGVTNVGGTVHIDKPITVDIGDEARPPALPEDYSAPPKRTRNRVRNLWESLFRRTRKRERDSTDSE
jgi:hypothetical protein